MKVFYWLLCYFFYLAGLLCRSVEELKDYMIDYNSLYFDNEIGKGLYVWLIDVTINQCVSDKTDD